MEWSYQMERKKSRLLSKMIAHFLPSDSKFAFILLAFSSLEATYKIFELIKHKRKQRSPFDNPLTSMLFLKVIAEYNCFILFVCLKLSKFLIMNFP